MASSEPDPDPPLSGLAPDEAFALLGSDTRLAIVRALWDAGAHHTFDDVDDDAGTVAFSDLQHAVSVRDNGQFNYHLSRLVPQLVTQTADGYRLSGAGKAVARSIATVTGESLFADERDLERPCPICGGRLTAEYDDQWLRVTCDSCPGSFGELGHEGTVYNAPFPPAGLEDRTPDEALTVGLRRCMLDAAYLVRRICRECAGAVSASVSVCEGHDPEEGYCGSCGTPYAVWGDVRCDTCRFAKRLPVEVFAMGLTPVIAFCHDHGVDLLTPTLDDLEAVEAGFETDVSHDPLRIDVTISAGDEFLAVAFDDTLSPLAIERQLE